MFDIPPPPTVPPNTPVAIIAQLEQPSELTRECVASITSHYGVNPVVMSVIHKVEGGYSGARIKNTNGSYDLGFSQINTIHMPALKRFGLTEKMVKNNNCVNLGVAAWHVRTVTKNQKANDKDDFFRAIARYHSKNEPHISVYTGKLIKAYDELIKEYGSKKLWP